jgi:phage-related protein
VKEATASEAVWASLGAAVGRTGESWAALKTGTESALLAMSKVTTYSDEQLAQALEKLMTFGLSYDDAMKALGKTIDFAAAKHMDLESAATIVGKAMDGNTSILKRYGVDITTTKDATAALKDAHDAAKIAIDGMGTGVDGWVTSITTAIGATTDFQTGLAGAKDKAGYLIDQFQQGNIDLPQFTAAMTSLGVPLDETKLKAGSAEEVLGALNKQFGGAAQEQAKTYAGVQERLKIATGEVAEKIGTMFLPALASLAEGMIPVVDGLGKGIDAIGSWLTEVGKMPEVKGFVDAAQGAFDGLWKGMQDFWGFLSETFGPVLQELGGALREVFDALAPIGQAFGEVWAAITGGQEGGDWLKDFLKFVAQFIREVVVPAIKEAVPIIKGFADAFKAAADFALPIITQIKDAVVGFINVLKDAFYGFYTWLVGGSLWMDTWNALLSVASSMIGTLLGDLGSKLFEPMKNAFTGALQAVENTWNTGWQTVHSTFTTLSQQIGWSINTQLEAWKTNLSTSTSQYAPIATQALTAMQTSVNVGMQLIQGDWQGALTSIQNALTQWGTVATGIMQGAMSQIQGAVSAGVSAIQGMFSGLVASAQGTIASLQGMFSQAQSIVSSIAQQAIQAATNLGQGIVAATQPATDTFTDLFNQAAAGVISAGKQLYDMLVGGSIWPDMFNTMESITDTTMASIESTVTSGFASTIASAQASLAELQAIQQQAAAAMMAHPTAATVQAASEAQQAVLLAQAGVTSAAGARPGGVFGGMWEPTTPMNMNPAQMADYGQKLADAIFTATIGRSPAGGPATAQEMLKATLPISVNIDGVTVARVTEQRMITQRQLAGQYGR